MALQPFVGPWPLVSFLILYTDGSTPWTGDQPVSSPLPTHKTTQTQNKRTRTSLPWMAFEPTIPAFERSKTVRAIDRAATVIGLWSYLTEAFTLSELQLRTPLRLTRNTDENHYLSWKIEHNILCCALLREVLPVRTLVNLAQEWPDFSLNFPVK
jgi:hypothetical protein